MSSGRSTLVFGNAAHAGARWALAVPLVLALPLTDPAHARDRPSVDRARIVRALMQISATVIPAKRVACEIAGPTLTGRDDSVRYPRTTVGDFLRSYLLWALEYRAATHVQSLGCTGTKLLQCEWMFGERAHAGSPGSQAFLKFQLDAKTGRVLPATLECIHVP